MSLNDKENGGLNTIEHKILRGLNNQYRADKFAERYSENEEYERLCDGSVQIDISTLSDEEFKSLFDAYMTASKIGSMGDMTDDAYKGMRSRIIQTQKQTGAILLSDDEMERRFADAEKAKEVRMEMELPEIPDEDDELFGATTEFIQPEAKMPPAPEKPAEAKAAPVATEEDSFHTQEILMMSEDQIKDAETIKKRRVSMFSRLKSFLRNEEEESSVEAQEVHIEEPEFIPTPDEEEDMEGATTEFISPFTAERDAIAASEMQVGDEIDAPEYIEEETSPEEEMLENHMDNTADLPAYVPEIVTGEIEVGADEEVEPEVRFDDAQDELTEEVFEEFPEEIPAEATEEILEDITPEEPVATLMSAETEAETLPEDSQIIDAFSAETEENSAKIPKNLFTETVEKTVEPAAEETAEQIVEEPEETDNYVSYDQNPEVLQEYKRKYNSVRIRMGVSAFFALLVLVFENIGIFGVQLPDYICNKALAVPLEWAVIFISAALCADIIWNALKKLFKFEFEPATVTLFGFVFSAAATMTALFTETEPKFYNFPFVLCVFITLLAEYFILRKEIFTFKMLSASKKKYAITLMNSAESAPEAEAFAEHLSKKSQFYRVTEVDFVDGYFAKRKRTPKMYKKLRVVFPIVFVASVAAAVLSIVLKDTGVYAGIVNGYLTFMMGAPVAVFFANELPMYFGAVNAYSQASAILGDTAPEAMENMSSVSFTDRDIFLPGDSVRIKGVKVIDNNRIDNIIYYATSALELIGGPLAKTFKQASLDNASPESAEIRLISENGIDAVIDGKHIVLGTYNFMDVQCFNPVKEANDHLWEGKTHKRMLYLACDEKIIAKFYIEYNVNPEFVSVVKRLSKAGVCVAIRTNDPCVDSDLFYKNKIIIENTFKIIKGVSISDEVESVYAGKAGAVSAGSIKGLIKTVVVCDRVRNVQKTNFVLKIVATVIGLLGMGFIIAMGVSFGMLWSIYFALYQLLWLVPVYIVSKVNI